MMSFFRCIIAQSLTGWCVGLAVQPGQVALQGFVFNTLLAALASAENAPAVFGKRTTAPAMQET